MTMDPVTARLTEDGGEKSPHDTVIVVPLFATVCATFKEFRIAIGILLAILGYLFTMWLLSRNQQFANVSHKQTPTFQLSMLDEDPIPEWESLPTTTVAVVERQTSEATADTSDPHLTIEDVFISVKTTKKFHRTRLDVVLQTWFKLARDQTYFFTDEYDEEFSRKTYNHLINTGCPSSHNRRALCCKMGAEFDFYLQSRKKWWCHFDDDNYVNVPQLLRNLQDFNYRDDWYLGKTSIKDPLETRTRGKNPRNVAFWFGTGGAGFCVSKALALKMKPIASEGRFTEIGETIRLPDDVTMGYVAEVILKTKLTVLPNFHSHLESLGYLEEESFKNQISFSYSSNGNVLSVSASFDQHQDPTRFISLHCHLFPQFDICRRLKRQSSLAGNYRRMAKYYSYRA